MEPNEITQKVLNEAFYVHNKIGPGMLENVYKTCLEYRITKAGLFVEREKPIPVFFEEVKMDCGYRADLVIERTIIIETKTVEAISPLHVAQLLTYLRFMNLRYGLIINFNTTHLKSGIKRVVNGYK